ncbi:MAG: PIG-L family deacetylase [Chloroflexi bacterium]|nr:PIG-L family deacetylase [Chloroflexota bacterium]
MAIFAHPDDAEYNVAGSAALWAREGREMYYVLCTDGGKGSSDRTITPARVAEIRAAEQREACGVLGVKDLICLGFEDGQLTPSIELRRELVRAIRRIRPDVVCCPDPTMRYSRGRYLNHPDHIATGEAALAAIYPSARDPLMFPELLAEGLEPHKVLEVLVWGSAEPDLCVDISETIDSKIAALRCHRSQTAPNPTDEYVRNRAAETGRPFSCAMAEAFKYIRLRG